MAAAVVDEDEAWLYGDDNSGKENAKVKSNGKRKKDDMEEGQLSGEEEGQEKKDTADSDDSDDDDEDDVQVTIGDIRQWSATDGGSKLFKGSGTYQKPAGVVVSKTGGATKGVDIEQQGTINGVPTYEFDITSIEDKPWRKPGADITDYFNYGFDEESWTVYCDKQKKLRAENGASYSSLSGSSMKKDINNTTSHTSQVATLIGRKAAPPPNRRYYGTIDVIGSTATNTRRPTETGTAINTITVTGGATEYNPAVPPPGMAPGIPDYSVPPPGLGVPPNLLPPGVTPNVSLPPPNYPPPGFYPPPGTIPTSEPYEERNYTYDPATGTYNFSSAPPTWDSRGSYGGGYNDYSSSRRDRSPVSDDEYSMSSHRDRERDRSSSYYRERDRERDRDSRSDRDRRDRDRDGERSRDRDRESSRERRHKDDSKHKKRRFKEEKDSDDHHSSSSKHKKSSRSKKRDKEGEESTDDKQTE